MRTGAWRGRREEEEEEEEETLETTEGKVVRLLGRLEGKVVLAQTAVDLVGAIDEALHEAYLAEGHRDGVFDAVEQLLDHF